MQGRRGLIAVSIVTFWLIMMGQLVSSELGVKRFEPGDRPSAHLRSPTESWFGVFLAEGSGQRGSAPTQRVGHVHLRQSPETKHGQAGVQMLLEARMQLQLLGKSTDLDLSGSVWRPDESTRAEFEFAVRSAGFDFSVAGKVEGGELRGEMTSAGEVFPLRLPVDDSLIFSSGLGSALRFPRLEVGDEYRLDSFDPLTLSKSEARVKCTARETLRLGEDEVSTCRLTVKASGLSSLAWIDDEGEVVRAETPVGLVLERLTPAQALSLPEPLADAADSLLAETAIRPSGKRPFRSARTMKVRFRGVESLKLPEDQVQIAQEADLYLLKVPRAPESGSSGDTEGGDSTSRAPMVRLTANEQEEYLRATTFVQSDHPKIRHQASAITEGEQDPWRRALMIHDWVFERLDKEPVVSIPSALEVLEQRRGDCNEHTVLFTALARAASVPTRIAIGIVWSDDLDGFYYHAWPEIFLDEVLPERDASKERPESGWYWMDPTLGQPLADATHIKLLNGGIETWPRLLPYLGKLEIEILEIE